MRSSALGLVALLASALISEGVAAATVNWKGHTWQVTSGGMAGVCQGNPANVTVDANGYLHFRIANAGGTWTAAEIFTTDRLGFGTYQWHVDGPIDVYDKNVVLGLFPYGPAAGIGSDGTNEIDIEYSRWGRENGPNGDFTNYPASGTTIGERSYTFSLGGSTLSTSRFIWTTTSITSSLLGELQPVAGGDRLIESFRYAPANPTMNIPQQALPLGMNLWCFDAPPSNGQPVEIVIRDFTFVPEGSSMGGGGAGGAGGRAGAGGTGGVGRGGAGAGGAGGGAGGRAGASGAGEPGGNGGNGANVGGVAGGGMTGAVGNAGVSATGGASGSGGEPSASGSGNGGSSGVAGTAGRAGEAGMAGSTGDGGTASNDVQDPQGCGCSVRTSDGGRGAALAGVLAMMLFARRRPR